VATEGVLGDLNPLGDGPCRSLADNGARVPKVLPAADLRFFFGGLNLSVTVFVFVMLLGQNLVSSV
jgi:hypothetical protein